MKNKTKKIQIGTVEIGGQAPIAIQSMTNTDTRDVKKTLAQIKALREAGCEIIRLAVPDMEAAEAMKTIVPAAGMPVVADIHFDYRLALASLDAGVHKIRINPGNIGADWKVREIVEKAKARGAAIRVGVNAGSLEKRFLQEGVGIQSSHLVDSVLDQVNLLESFGFDHILISAKASSVPLFVETNRQLAKATSYPLHLGVTEAGFGTTGIVKSTAGLAILLSEGIGDTIRVSLTGDPVQEVEVAWALVKSLGLRSHGIEWVSCPTCGRTKVNLQALAAQAKARLAHIETPYVIAIMGCEVNGPGEAANADFGIAGGAGRGVVFQAGKIVKTLPEDLLVDALVELVEGVDKKE
jgi:(E)-4-hydroxy-3-methylbut-2-enyl-diphosphate synthase